LLENLLKNNPIIFIDHSPRISESLGERSPIVKSREAAILLVDNDKESGLMLGKLLELSLKVEHNCIVAASAEEAMKLLESTLFHLVLTDIRLPGVSGLDLCGFLHRAYPTTVVIIVSGLTDIKYAIGAMRSGAFDYITKPVNATELIQGVERALNYQEALMVKHYCEQSLEEEVNDLLSLNHRLRSAALSSQSKKLAAKISG
jgi:DNA-binding NtrC family response regulator